MCLQERRQAVQRWVTRWSRTVVLRPEEAPGTGSNRGQGLALKEDGEALWPHLVCLGSRQPQSTALPEASWASTP